MNKLHELSSFDYKPIFHGIIGKSPPMIKIFKLIEDIAATNTTVLISGETGTGKELVARAIHSYSNKIDRQYGAVNCAAISDKLLEEKLFGFGGGLLSETFQGGTIFIDEIDEMPISTQAKFLNFLQHGTINPLEIPNKPKTYVRVITATNKNLEALRDEGKFGDALYYRLNVICLEIPPLRDRKEDIPLLVSYFVKTLSEKYNTSRITHISEGTINQLQSYNWPGNIRELESMVHKALVLSKGNVLEIDNITETQEINEPINFEVAPFPFLIDPGNATEEDIANIFIELSTLYRKMGGEGLQFTFIDYREYAKSEVFS